MKSLSISCLFVLLLPLSLTNAKRIGRKKKVSSPIDADCGNNNELCDFWAEKGECAANPNYMKKECCAACRRLAPTAVSELTEPFSVYYGAGRGGVDKRNQVPSDDAKLKTLVALSSQYGTEQQAQGPGRMPVGKLLRDSLAYLNHNAALLGTSNDDNDKVVDCRNDNAQCTTWATQLQCTQRPEFMHAHCAAACGVCVEQFWKQQSQVTKCAATDEFVFNAAGGLHNVFSLLAQEQSDDDLEIYTKPDPEWYDQYDAGVLRDKSLLPWLVALDNVLSAEECQALVDESSNNVKPVSSFRDESGAAPFDYQATWLAQTTPAAATLVERVTEALHLSADYATDVKISKFEPGEHYHTIHHDYEPSHWEPQTAVGPRVLTVQIYLTGNGEDDGTGTRFNNLQTTVPAQTGRAMIFPNVLASDLAEPDLRLRHEDFMAGGETKYVATVWFHLRNYQAAKENKCVVTEL